MCPALFNAGHFLTLQLHDDKMGVKALSQSKNQGYKTTPANKADKP